MAAAFGTEQCPACLAHRASLETPENQEKSGGLSAKEEVSSWEMLLSAILLSSQQINGTKWTLRYVPGCLVGSWPLALPTTCWSLPCPNLPAPKHRTKWCHLNSTGWCIVWASCQREVAASTCKEGLILQWCWDTASSWILMHQEEALRASKRDFPWRASSSGSLCSNTTLHSHARPPQFQQGHSKAEGCMDFIKPRPSLPCPEILTCSICY